MEKKEVLVQKIIPCGKFTHRHFIIQAECEKCQWHGGLIKISEGGNDLPELFEVVCGLPRRIRIERVIIGGSDASTE